MLFCATIKKDAKPVSLASFFMIYREGYKLSQVGDEISTLQYTHQLNEVRRID